MSRTPEVTVPAESAPPLALDDLQPVDAAVDPSPDPEQPVTGAEPRLDPILRAFAYAAAAGGDPFPSLAAEAETLRHRG